ncbi:MAG: hypothetical protein L6Q97_02915 [Thermoanaerobaculia bacterium]|nr:hypothetical protein [Thermoanaerobaculia bacterium]
MKSNSIPYTDTSAQDLSTQSTTLPPLWERSPNKFWAVHKNVIPLNLNEWLAKEPELSLAKAISRYVDGLPADTPADILIRIIEMVIEAWEKQSNAKAA